MRKSIMSSLAAAAAVFGIGNPYRNNVGNTGKHTDKTPLTNTRVKKRIRYNFMDMMRGVSATKKYVNGKLKNWQRKEYTKAVRVGRGALGARERACGVHWVKQLHA